ncbi:type II toxin-antitoxin system Phd/YefM family antitoxin [Rhodopseudomonas sp. BR0G17]|uniref:type II toxin-antitoxin system Phd/YefM family antitoxin n=1 Tax=Rhodopseudomonas sp. BR0G17 TaxID=2269368 RepID=UPI0013E03CCE|nr:type II toxin-antitoxin system Phd/YefM family antitoxin [Rhodopseudomonas sp. BR0G17]NEW96067.1 type II toxin-antitoxin system Phd/YefM family antitoxin [Rhodopseudomonas sp. BR0G17]
MIEHRWSMQDAKNRFSELVEAARRNPQTVTKHGEPAVLVMDVAEFERLRRLEHTPAPSFSELLLSMPKDDGEFSRGAVRSRDLDR